MFHFWHFPIWKEITHTSLWISGAVIFPSIALLFSWMSSLEYFLLLSPPVWLAHLLHDCLSISLNWIVIPLLFSIFPKFTTEELIFRSPASGCVPLYSANSLFGSIASAILPGFTLYILSLRIVYSVVLQKCHWRICLSLFIADFLDTSARDCLFFLLL